MHPLLEIDGYKCTCCTRAASAPYIKNSFTYISKISFCKRKINVHNSGCDKISAMQDHNIMPSARRINIFAVQPFYVVMEGRTVEACLVDNMKPTKTKVTIYF